MQLLTSWEMGSCARRWIQGSKSAEYFAPLNLEVHSDPHQQQRLFVEWDFNDGVYVSGLNVIFHIQVARSRQMNIIHEEYYNTSVSGSGEPFSWLWDSQLPLECDSHSFRIRSAVLKDSFPSELHWSAWSPWKTHYGKNENRTDIVIYPHEKIVLEGSDVTFCCLPGLSSVVQNMFYKNEQYPNKSQQMKTESFVILVKNVSMTRSDGANVVCRVDPMSVRKGTVLIVSRPPTEPNNFSCETNDLQRLHCTWRPGPKYNFYGPLAEKYTLHEWVSGRSASCSRENCTWPVARNQQIYNFTLNVKNILGEKSIQAVVDLAERVRPVAPMNLVTGYINATDARLIWTLKADYTSLILRCQTDLKGSTVNVTVKGKTSLEMYSISLPQLQPFTKYDLRVRCMSESSLAGWSNWSDAFVIQTQEAAPSAPLDVWREIHHNESGQTVTLYWKHPSGFSANGNISHYNIKWWPLGGNIIANKTRVSAHRNSYSMDLGTQAHAICITAQNSAGVSPAAEIKVPGTNGSSNTEVNTERTHGRDGEINVTWRPVPAVYGYVVEWCNSPRSPHCALQWKKYNSSSQGDVIHSESFQRGVRYNFRIYGSKEDGEHLLEKLTGYTEELVSSEKPKVVTTNIDANSLSLDWSPYPIDETQEGFVMGYTIYVKTLGRNCELDASDRHIILDGLEVCRFFIKDPKIMNATIRQLKPNTEYQVAVVAVTGGGETDIQFTKASTQADAGAMIMSILLPVIIVSVLVVILLIAGCWKRACLKETCYPNIPKPNKSKVLSFSSPKGPACVSILPDVTSIPQEVERVTVLKKVDSGHDLKESDQQTETMYSTIQRPPNTISTETSDAMYFPNSSEHGSPLNQTTEELLYKPQSPTYLEFFNENYIGNSEDSYEESFGYRPQIGSTQLHQSSCEYPTGGHSQDTELEPGHHLRITDFSASENEPVSPTSVNSTSFILKD
ncbi:PREDICTED: oncostatin-M-specific receptor subunit beta [Nanorana parkeri]|uniref:oncostatin-M-specific receptor subunit beta n=1 Tax=Nanorana parkeri TaxID=125878 RepID=UPI000854FD9D|nr:PREDICTED: oncostatin-M-specific receptor subunit beta [Nanorana parkeri]